MPTSARWEVANLPQISVKPVHSAGGQSRPPYRRERGRCRGRRLCRPKKYNEFAENSRKTGAFCGRTESSAPTGESGGRCRGRRLCRPKKYNEFAEDFRKNGARTFYSSGSSAAVSGSCISSKAFWASSKITCTSANASCRRERPVDRSAASAAISSPESI